MKKIVFVIGVVCVVAMQIFTMRLLRGPNYFPKKLSKVSLGKALDAPLLSAMPQDRNYILSPFSLKIALAMAANGAEGATQDEILNVLGIENLTKFNSTARKKINAINRTEEVSFNVVNSIWNNTDHFSPAIRFSGVYNRIMWNHFEADVRDITDSGGADEVNNWIALQTKDKIKDVIDDQMIREATLFLVNTVYFNGDWARPFDADHTHSDTFTDRNGKQISTRFMADAGAYFYCENDNFKMLAKPYADTRVNMYFVLPNVGKSVSWSDMDKAITGMTEKRIIFKVPKFQTEYLHENLIEILQGMGVNAPFDPVDADFSKMYSKTPPKNVYIGSILQKTFIQVDEKGTEAAAATVAEMTDEAAAEAEDLDILVFNCDRPFVYFIRNDTVGEILFVGEYAFVN